MKRLKNLKKTTKVDFATYLGVIVAFVIVSLLQSGGLLTRSISGMLVPICCYIVMAVSLNLVVGVSGELSLGHAGFMSVGAFSGVIAAMSLQNVIPSAPIRLVIAMIIGAAFAALAGFVVGVPVLRLRGDYLAIVTLAFGEIIRNVINCLYISMDNGVLHIAFNNPNLPGKLVVNGPTGATGNPKIATFAVGFGLVLFTLFVVLNLINSRSGRAIMASRDNRIAAESMGVNVTKYKMMAFVTSAVLAGMAGALYGLNYSSVAAVKFKFDTSILVLVFVVLGGIGSIRGSIIAATLLTVLPEMLREFNDYRMLVYAIVLILVMLATNNPTLKMWVGRLIPKKNQVKEGEHA